MDKLPQQTPDLTQQNIDRIAELFPSAVTETKDADGKLKKTINFTTLKQILSADVVDGDECYEFTWVGKKQSIIEGNKPIRKTLRPAKDESKNWDTTENLYIEGDNLEVLKLLQNSYLNSIKMIYIDPPYNTGNDFVYRDDFAVSREEYEDEKGVYDEDENRLFKNTETNGRFHSDWCSMMYPRLQLARDLLSDDGVIFISIDDNEVHNLRKMCDEVFGDSNFIGCAGRISKKANNQGDYWAPNFDYLLTYSKKKTSCPAFFGGINYSAYNLVEDEGDRKGERYQLVRLYMTSLDPMRGCNNQRYFIECPDGSLVIPPGTVFPEEKKDGAQTAPQSGKDKVWRWSQNSYIEKKDKIVVKKVKSSNLVNENGEETYWNVFTKTYLNDVISKLSATPNSFIENHINQIASHELKILDIPFDFAKPTSLIKYLAQISQTKENDTLLDFFSGSASSADAIMQLNAEDGGNRKFIMVQLPEATDEKSEAYKAGYKNICEIGKERIRRAGKKLAPQPPKGGAKSESLNLFGTDNGNSELKTPNAKLDTGFRVLKLDDTNMKDVYYSAGDYSQQLLLDLESNIKEDRTDLDLLYGVLLDWGVSLSLPHSTEIVGGKKVHFVNETDLVACFEENVNETVVREIAKRKPLRVVFRDSSFGSSPEKINVSEIFKTLSPDTTVKVI